MKACPSCGAAVRFEWVGRTLRAVDVQPCHQVDLLRWVYPIHRCRSTGCAPRGNGCVEVDLRGGLAYDTTTNTKATVTK